ncbi:MAG: aminoglycoside phosphotransferase [Egibacteraceae bacterium]
MSWTPDPDHRHHQVLRLTRAADLVRVILDSEPVYGWRDRTVGARARTENGLAWLRVLTAAPERAHGKIWDGTATAEAVQGVAKPTLTRAVEWDEDNVRIRADLTTFIADQPCSPTPELRQPLDLPGRWWRSLRASLDAVAATPTDRVTVRQDLVARRVTTLVGYRVDPTVRSWATAHGDLHWANLTQPTCCLLDWEGWGLAPVGFDAAMLYGYTLLQPELAEHVYDVFRDILDTPEGVLAQLFVIAELLVKVSRGDHPELEEPLHHETERILGWAADGAMV